MKNKSSIWNMIRIPAFFAAIAAIVTFFYFSIGNLGAGSDAESKIQLENALRRAAVSCYATEGRYPEDIKYLEDHYGIQINNDKYVVFYQVFASNLMPEIDVVDKD